MAQAKPVEALCMARLRPRVGLAGARSACLR